LKIGIVLSKTPSYSETFFISKIKGLIDSGFEVILFVQKRDDTFSLCKVRQSPRVYKKNVLILLFNMILVLGMLCVRRPKKILRFISLERNANRSNFQILKNTYNNSHILQADLDWVHFGFATMAIQSEHIAKAIDAKLGVSFRGFDIDVFPLKNKEPYKLLWEQIDKVHSISEYLLSKAYTLGLSPSTSFQIITPAVDMTALPDKKVQTNDIIKILTVGRLHWIKGINYILEALALLKARQIEFEYHIVGNGLEYETLKYSTHQLKLTDNVTIHSKLSHEDVLRLMSECHIYVQYSHSEGFCNAVLEAQAMSLLCIVSDGGALPENVIHEKTGWVVPKRNSKLLARTIQEVINLPEDQKFQVKSNAHQRVLSVFNLEKQRKEFNEFYSE
jgi:colanic acid/amylovoran biosynthesis glycosyltransferase